MSQDLYTEKSKIQKDYYNDTAEKYDADLYPFFLDGVAGFIELNQNDRIHPNPRGVKIITAKMASSIIEALK